MNSDCCIRIPMRRWAVASWMFGLASAGGNAQMAEIYATDLISEMSCGCSLLWRA